MLLLYGLLSSLLLLFPGLTVGLPFLKIVGECAINLCCCCKLYKASSSLSGDIAAKSGKDCAGDNMYDSNDFNALARFKILRCFILDVCFIFVLLRVAFNVVGFGGKPAVVIYRSN